MNTLLGSSACYGLLLASACALSSATPALYAQVPLAPGVAHYAVVQGGKTLGEARYSVAAIAGGYTISSSGHMALGKFSYSFANQATVDSSLNLVRDELTGSVSDAKVHGSNLAFHTHSDATGRELQIDINADGKQTSNGVDRHRNTVLAPDLDPGAYLLMARLALQQPPTAWVLIPKENGLLVPAAYVARPDVRGSFNSANINVKHATAELSDTNSITLELFYGADGQLFEADLNAQGLDLVRDGFRLLEHPAPTPPPPGQPPQTQPGMQQQDGQQAPPVPQMQ